MANGQTPFSNAPVDKLTYGIDKVDFLRDKLAGYGGGVTIASEMIQNADDAGASVIRFYFGSAHLLVYNNSEFQEQDFRAITNIASGSKRADEGKIGTWGTGFLSVYHITDAPGLHSAGFYMQFDPTKNDVERFRSPYSEGTRFVLPWRRQSTPLSKRIEANAWNENAIQELRDALIPAIYAHILFLRHVRIIEVYEGEEGEKAQLLSAVERKEAEGNPLSSHIACGETEIVYKRARQPERSDKWIYYHTELPRSIEYADVTAKDYRISLAFPLENRAWLDENVPGALYNFLPTPIRTGFAFQLNGAFFPDNNRKQILLDEATQRAKARWNQLVLKSLSRLWMDVLLDMRDRCQSPRRFYDLFPLHLPATDYLAVFRQTFVEEAERKEIVFTSLERWKLPKDVWQGLPASKLQVLAEAYLDVLPTGIPQSVRDYLQNRCTNLNWQVILDFLRPHLVSNRPLGDAHGMINSREKLSILYREIPNTLRPDEAKLLRSLALCLDADERLQRFDGRIWRGERKTRELLSGLGVPFVDEAMQSEHPRFLEGLVKEFRGQALVEWLADVPWPDTPFPLANAPQKIWPTEKRLQRYIYFIEDDWDAIDSDQLALVPLIYGEDGHLYTGTDAISRLEDKASREALRPFGLCFVHAEWGTDGKIANVYEGAGVSVLKPGAAIAQLRRIGHKWAEHLSVDDKVALLLPLYQYFHFHRADLSPEDKQALRRLPISLSQQGALMPMEQDNRTQIFLPARSVIDDPSLTVLGRLELDNLIHSRLLQENGRHFLVDVLQMEELNPLALIKDVIVPHYADERLGHDERRTLLDYIRRQTRGLDEEAPIVKEMRRALEAAPLLRSQNDEYRHAASLYFPSGTLDAIFDGNYPCLHKSYGITQGANDNADKPYRQHEWFPFLRRLGVQENPTPADLIAAVKRIVASGPPDDERVARIRRIYQWLRQEVGVNRRFNPEGTELAPLRELAWLPTDGDQQNWYLPRNVYPASLRELVGEQARLLRLEQPTGELAQLLGIQSSPPVELVVKYLMASAEQDKEVSPRAVYGFLAREAADSHIENLRKRRCVWDNERQRYWLPRHIFFGNHHQLFGERRGYMHPPGGDVQDFLEKLGVRAQPDEYDDSVALLREIAQEYLNNSGRTQAVPDEDRRLLLLHYGRIGDRPVQALASLPVVLGQDGSLYWANRIVYADLPELLQHFPESAVPCVTSNGLSESGLQFLQRLGVRRLSQLVRRTPAQIRSETENVELAYRIKKLAPHLERIAQHLSEEEGAMPVDRPSRRLKGITIQTCDRLTIDYSLDDRAGWRIDGNRQPNQNALYDTETNTLYVSDVSDDGSRIALAKELEFVLFPGHKESPVIERLLEMSPVEIPRWLDSHGYRRLLDGSDTHTLESASGKMADWGVIPSEIEPERETEPDEPESNQWHGEDDVSDDIPAQGFLFDTPPEDAEVRSDVTPLGTSTPPAIPAPAGALRLSTPNRQRSEGTGEDSGSVTKREAAIPPFTGQPRPVVPVLPNNYGELQAQFGLSRFGNQKLNEITSGEAVEEDEGWVDDWDDPTTVAVDGKRRTTVRFTLTFQNRYEGFLPLHRTVREMLVDEPGQLLCQTDSADWSFPLYVDYARGLIYNQRELPRYLDARSIPAGGIIYLERVHGDVVRIFWKAMAQRVEKVRCLELLEDGTLEEFEIDAVDVPCEVSEYVLRAEKRLEDTPALFRQAMDKRGAFQTICNVFGKPGKELSFDEIFRGVQSIRQVAKTTIDNQLTQRPCFVQTSTGLWRFEPERGSEAPPPPRSVSQWRPSPQRAESGTQPAQPGKPPVPAAPMADPPVQPSPEAEMVALARGEWNRIGKWLDRQSDPGEQLKQLLAEIERFHQRLQSDVASLVAKVESIDSVADQLWRQVCAAPDDQAKRQQLETYFRQTLAKNKSLTLGQLRQNLATTEGWMREQIFFPLLREMADYASRRNLPDAARSLYQLLQDQRAGDFNRELAQFEVDDNVKSYIALVSESNNQEERWRIWQEAWQEFPGNALLRQEICRDVVHAYESLSAERRQENKTGQTQRINQWLDWTYPLIDVWLAIPQVETIWLDFAAVGREVLDGRRVLGDQSDEQILRLASRLPEAYQARLSIHRLLEIYEKFSDSLFQNGDIDSATLLLEYALQMVETTKATVEVDRYVAAYEKLAERYEQLERPDKAYSYLGTAQRLTIDGEHKQKIGNKRHPLRLRREFVDDQKVAQWQAHALALLESPRFGCLVNGELYRRTVVDRLA